jgi:hypothetical protein
MKQLFQYTVILHEHNTDECYVDSKLIIEPTFKLAKSEKDLVFQITREIPEEHAGNPDNIQILVRNF